MKKKLLLAAITTALSGTVYAETSVTLYGLIDAGIGYSRVSGSYVDPTTGDTKDFKATRTGMVTGKSTGSRWGLRGKEDLGGGVYATFRVESGFNPATGNSEQNGRLFGRESTLGIGSDSWGEISFGRHFNVATRMMLAMFGPKFGGGYHQLQMGNGLGHSAGSFVRYDNLAMYQSPSISGFKFAAGYSSNVDSMRTAESGFATADNTRAITAGLSYQNGPLMAYFAYDQLKASDKLSATQKDATPRAYSVGGSYDFEVLKLALAYERTTDGWFAGKSLDSNASIGSVRGTPTNAFVKGFKANSYLVAVSVPFNESSSMFGSWQRVKPNNSNLTGGDSTSNTFALGYTYALSKRTNVYAVGSYTKNYAFLSDAKLTTASIGLRHAF
ncbi:porin [Parapusillimonas sp. JC17]|uniref:porin n=1 Tax=Parapusillimonas sp. JC17 TaxID=3445768 RepID=UPI003FA087EF